MSVTNLEEMRKKVESMDFDNMEPGLREQAERFLRNMEKAQELLKKLKEVTEKINKHKSDKIVVTTNDGMQIVTKKGGDFSAN